MTGRGRYGFPAALLTALIAWAPAAAQEGSDDLIAPLTESWHDRVLAYAAWWGISLWRLNPEG